jgi:hypothetical protein
VHIQQIEGNCFAPEVPREKNLKIYICTQAIKTIAKFHMHTSQNKKIKTFENHGPP